ncbi:hypothetical protein EA772_13605 [Pedobacter sp. G11]|nr:hypothetical protein EA772_13605 [Pedobacter sp. G11]
MQPQMTNFRHNFMKRILIVIILFTPWIAKAQNEKSLMADSVRAYLDSSLNIIRKHSLNTKINWNDLRSNVYSKAVGANRYEDILHLYPYIFEQIDDHHGSLKFRGKTYSWNKKAVNPVNNTIATATKKYQSVHAENITKDIAYILIPGNTDFRGKQMDSIAKEIKNAISKINNQDIKGWVIDLRVNTGGNMYPMIAGLSDLIGEGKVGGFLTSTNEPDGAWIIKNGSFYVDSVKVSPIKYSGYPIKKDIPVALLISGNTASSGEMTAISFIGRRKSVIIGEQSGGYTTSNLGFKLNEYSGLNLAVDYAADRNGKIYPKYLIPDYKVLNGDDFENLNNDLKIKKALIWLRKNK